MFFKGKKTRLRLQCMAALVYNYVSAQMLQAIGAQSCLTEINGPLHDCRGVRKHLIGAQVHRISNASPPKCSYLTSLPSTTIQFYVYLHLPLEGCLRQVVSDFWWYGWVHRPNSQITQNGFDSSFCWKKLTKEILVLLNEYLYYCNFR